MQLWCMLLECTFSSFWDSFGQLTNKSPALYHCIKCVLHAASIALLINRYKLQLEAR